MYTGIVQGVGRIVTLTPTVSGVHIALRFPHGLLRDLQLGASVSVDGVCLSVVCIEADLISFDAINATLDRTNLGDRRVGDVVNLERSARQGDENGGHAMYGHVSDTARISAIVLDGPRAHVELKVSEPWCRWRHRLLPRQPHPGDHPRHGPVAIQGGRPAQHRGRAADPGPGGRRRTCVDTTGPETGQMNPTAQIP
jgi:hypothetical protein